MTPAKFYRGDCLEVLKRLQRESVDALVTDPPAGISFMGKDWDGDKGGREGWVKWMTEVMAECHRVLKPGAHGLVWALPRTSHWTATALEDAGFEIRDCIYHLFGQGFPKSLDISKAIDKAAGAEREVVGFNPWTNSKLEAGNGITGLKQAGSRVGGYDGERVDSPITAPATDDAKKWQGFGTALKPAAECWWLVRKPISEKNVAANVLRHGTGGLNIDGCRIGTTKSVPASAAAPRAANATGYGATTALECRSGMDPNTGRFPSHLVLSHSPHCTDEQCDIECAIDQLDRQSGTLTSGSRASGVRKGVGYHGGKGDGGPAIDASSGGASRFFYCAKISPSERGEGNNHPTVKPQKLMRYLARLITPPGGTVLDPFMGSGSTGMAALSEGFQFIGIEREPEYFEIAQKRVEAAR